MSDPRPFLNLATRARYDTLVYVPSAKNRCSCRKDAGDKRLADGTEVTLLADHMTGMKGAKATIDHSTDETVYMVDFEAGAMTMTNHKWVVDSEIRPAP